MRIVHRSHPGALASIYLWFDVGTVDETNEEAGAAHLLEHMLFKGTHTRGVGVCAAQIEAMGGDLNAYTTWDQTVLHATVLAEHWEAALEVLADMAWNSTLDPEELDREKPVVLEEIRGYDDDPDSVVDDRTTARLFPDHPYGRPVLGTVDSVNAISRDALFAFWRRHYTDDRCILGVVGPMTEAQVHVATSKHCSIAPSGPPRQAVPPLNPHEPGVQRVDRDFDTPLVSIAFTIPGEGHPDNAPLEILANALGSGRASLLQSELRMERGLVADVWCSSYNRRTTGSLEIGLAPLPGKTDEAIAAALQLLESAKHGRLSSVEVDRARRNVLADLLYGIETVDSIAHDLVWYMGRHGSLAARDVWTSQVSSVHAEQVQRVARSLCDPVITLLDPTATGHTLATAAVDEPDLSGVDVHFSGPDDGWKVQGPLASIYLTVPGGRLLQSHARAGLVGMWASLLTTGAGDLDNTGLARALDALSASVGAIAGRNTLGIQLTVPAINLVPATQILRTMLIEPRFERSELDRLKTESRLDLDTLPDRPEEVLSRRVWNQTWHGHPWAWALTRSSLARITPRSVRDFHESWFSRDQLQVAVAGDVDRQAALTALAPLLAELPTGVSLPPRPSPDAVPTGMSVLSAGREQAAVAIATRTAPMGSPHDAAIRVASAILSAQSGRLFMSLRERDSLAYSVWSRVWEGLDGGLFTVGLATDPQRITAARRGLRHELERLCSDGPTAEELERTRAMMLGQFAMGQQRSSTRAMHLGLSAVYGRSATVEAYRAELLSADAGAIRDALASLPDPFTVVVRPRRPS